MILPAEKTEFITDYHLYENVILGKIPSSTRFLWLGTSDLKDMYVKQGKRMIPFLALLARLVERGVSVRLIHAKEPGPAFRRDFDKFPVLFGGLERLHCPRIHFKCVIIDGNWAYTGSANLTGAGLGAKSSDRRNFESGVITTEPELIDKIMEQFDALWMGKPCRSCQRKEYCTDYKEMLLR